MVYSYNSYGMEQMSNRIESLNYNKFCNKKTSKRACGQCRQQIKTSKYLKRPTDLIDTIEFGILSKAHRNIRQLHCRSYISMAKPHY